MTEEGSGAALDEDGRPVLQPAEIEGHSVVLRKAIPIRKAPEPGSVKTPDDVIRDMDEIDRLAAQAVGVLREAERTFRTLKRAHTVAWAKAYKNAQGTVKDREADADRDPVVLEAWEAVDNAEIAMNYARQVSRLIEQRGSRIQTQSKLVELTYHLAGRGR